MTGPGRPPIGKPVPVRLPGDLRAALDRQAEREGVPIAEVVRRACVIYLLHHEFEPQTQ